MAARQSLTSGSGLHRWDPWGGDEVVDLDLEPRNPPPPAPIAPASRRRARSAGPRLLHGRRRSGQNPRTARSRQRRRRRRRTIAAVVSVLLLPGIWSYGRALTYPGSASYQMRSVDWLRGHGGASLVNQVENWWYIRHPPPTTGRPPSIPHLQHTALGASRSSPPAPTIAATTTPTTTPGPARVHPRLAPSSPGEAGWNVVRSAPDGSAELETSYFRPDPDHPTVLVGAAWMNTRLLRTVLVPGTAQPAHGGPWAWGSRVPPTVQPHLVAAFNSGWKLQDTIGGFYAEGTMAKPLVAGEASLEIHRDGRVSIVAWPVGGVPPADVVAVRQNLKLVVNGGQPVPGLDVNANGAWGSAKNQLQYTWRSSIGVDRHGNLIYVAGKGLTLATLASAMVQAGVVTGMQLDIHTDMVTYNVFHQDPATHAIIGQKLLPAMFRPADRYLRTDQRDFLAVIER